MDGCRAFVGLPLPESYQQALATLRQRLGPWLPGRGVSWTRPGNWHVTLRFLGDVSWTGPGGVDAVKAALAGLAFAPFDLSGAGGGFFPDERRPRVAWIGLDQGRAACAALAAAVGACLQPVGFAPEDRPFSPHLTVARFREPPRGAAVASLLRELDRLRLPVVPVRECTLWRSRLGPAGPVYEALATVPAAAVGA